MIKNIVWDIGGVLIDDNINQFLRDNYDFSDDMIDFVDNEIFNSIEYQKDFNMGKITMHEVETLLIRKYPDKTEIIQKVLNLPFAKLLPIRTEVLKFIDELRTLGYKTYILSNISKEIKDSLIEQDFEFETHFDGRIYSFEEKLLKPAFDTNFGSDLYQVLLNRYGLNPNETVFLDDSKNNIEMAKKIGIYGIQYTDLKSAYEQIKSIVMEINAKTTSFDERQLN